MTQESIHFTIFGHPIKWQRVGRNKKTGAVYDPQKAKKALFAAFAQSWQPNKPLKGPLHVELRFYFQRPDCHDELATPPVFAVEAADIDNLCKFILDALQGTFWANDKTVVSMTTFKAWADDKRPRTEINIIELEN